MSTDPSYERYQRQLILKGFGETGQQKLRDAKVLVIGAGGLGCPALQYLVAAGVGTVGIVDDDMVSLSNLHRQLLYTTGDIGEPKALIAKSILEKQNPGVDIIAYQQHIDSSNAFAIMTGYDIIIDGTDNFATRYLVNDACVLLSKTLVYGAVSQFEGQVAIFNHINTDRTIPVNYRDLFPVPPKNGEVLNCAEAGVLGVLPGIIGTMLASETIKLVTGIGQPLINSLLTYNALTNQLYTFRLTANPESRGSIPADITAFEKTDYEWLCATPLNANEIDADSFNNMLGSDKIDIIDVREHGEQPLITAFAHLQIPLGKLSDHIAALQHDTIIVYCQSGVRSAKAAQQLSTIFGNKKKIHSLQGGIISWINATKQNQST